MKRETTKRNIQTFEPCGPVSLMIQNELRGKSRGAKTKLMERALVNLLGAKYPKLAERFEILNEEAA